jgi:hypothetical protein
MNPPTPRQLKNQAKQGHQPIQTVFLPSFEMYTVPIVSKELGLHAIQNLSRRRGFVIISDWIDSALLIELQESCSSAPFSNIMRTQGKNIRKDGTSYDANRKLRITSPDGRGLVDSLASKIAVQMAKHGVSVQAPAPIQSSANSGPQAAHIDMPSNDQGFACILSIDENTTFDLILKYKGERLATRRETIPLKPGHTVMFPGNQPHAGSSYEQLNIRWHYYTPLSPSLSMEQRFVYATTEMEDRCD